MKKRYLLIVLVLCLFIVGCGNSEPQQEKNKEGDKKEEVVVDETLFVINKLEFHMDKDSEFKGIKYTISSSFKEANQVSYVQYNYYQEDNTNLLFFRIFYYNNKKIDYAINDLGLDKNISLTDGKTNDIDYKFYASPRDDGGTIHFYFINKGNDLYVLNFVSKYDIKDFENKVLKSIKF